GHHRRIGPVKRFEMLFDEARFEKIKLPTVLTDPLKFKDQKKYTDRLKDARKKTGEEEALLVVEGLISGKPTTIAAFNFSFMGGSMGMAVGEGLVTAAQHALAKQTPLIVIPASGGARMQEGILSLMQMPRSTIAIQQLKEAGLPYIVLLTDPTTGGVSASFAMLGDIAISEPKAMIGFAGARVIKETIREELPEGFQSAEYLLEHGMVDTVVPRAELKDTIARIIDLLTNKRVRYSKPKK
ncbi:MAG: acetyl-CoA carboxylase, carboxyltransferase subunit beta, partial [bacterium]|nr:acetyl-CoA carboxylase, carboxyltransferase subunit beta [bacterium]